MDRNESVRERVNVIGNDREVDGEDIIEEPLAFTLTPKCRSSITFFSYNMPCFD